MAAAFKLKGNEAFKSGDYVGAIGAYTSAMMKDTKDATFPLNRAAAYLKLSKFQDAERDCTKVLSLDSKNVKALFRRGQARAGLGNYQAAKADLDQVLLLAPTDQTAKIELAKVQQHLAEAEKQKKAKVPPKEVTPSSLAPYRRRIPIEIVDDEEPPSIVHEAPNAGTSSGATRKGPLIEEIPDGTSASESSTPPKTFQQAKQFREPRGPRKVGIMRRDGSHSDAIFAPKTVVSDEVATSSSRTTVETQSLNGSGRPKQLHLKPTNAFEFQRQWKSDPSSPARWSALQAVPPESLPAFFKNSMEPPLLSSIFTVLLDATTQKLASKELVAAYLQNLREIPRFETMTLFFSDSEQKTVQELNNLVRKAS